MKRFLVLSLCGVFSYLSAFENVIQFENEKVRVSKVKVLPNEETGVQRNDLAKVVVVLNGGVVTRIDSHSTARDVEFQTGTALFREIDPPDSYHRAINISEEPIELMIIQLKQ